MTHKKLPYGYGLAFPTLFGLYIRRIHLRKWTFGFWGAGFLVVLLYTSLIDPGATSGPRKLIDFICVSFVWFLWGCPGFIFACRKEALGRFGNLRGRDAVIAGLIMMFIFWGEALYNLYLGLKGTIR